MNVNDLTHQEGELANFTEVKPVKQFKTLVIPAHEGMIDEILADYTADGWRIIHQNDVVAYNDDGHTVLHIVRFERVVGLKGITGEAMTWAKRILTGGAESSAFDHEIQNSIADGWRVTSDTRSTGWIDGTGNTRTVVLVRERAGV